MIAHGNQPISRDGGSLDFLPGNRATNDLQMTSRLGSRKQRAAMLRSGFPNAAYGLQTCTKLLNSDLA